jgi:hypothetical protein
MKNHRPSYLLVLLLGVFLLSKCDDPVGIITYEQPEAPNGKREWVIRVADDKGVPINGYSLKITGPTSVDVNVSGTEYIFTNLATGTYRIQVSKTGFIGNTLEVSISLPSDLKLGFLASNQVNITALAPPIAINNATGGTVTTPGSTASGPRSQPTSITIPPGAFGSSGTTNISLTRRPPSPVTSTNSSKIDPDYLTNLTRIPLDVVIFDTPGITSFSAITLGFPMGIPTSIRNATYDFVVMSGSLTTGVFEPTAESIRMTVTESGGLAVSITKPGIYRIYANLGLSSTSTQSSPFTIGTTACGVGGNFTVTSPTAPALGPILSFLGVVPSSVQVSSTLNLDAVAGASIRVQGIYNYLDYRVLSSTGATLETYRYPLSQVSVATTITNCHNSGGS